MQFEKVSSLDTLWSGEKISVQVNGRKILLVNISDEVFAFDDRCPHQAVPLSEGELNGCVLTCRAHHWQFDAKSGEGMNPEGVRIRRHLVEIRDRDVYISLAEARGET